MSEGDPAGGTVRIPNRLIDALLLADLSKRQMLVALAIIRRTLGWRKPSDVLSSQQIADATGLKRQHVAAAILELANLGILDREPAGQSFRLSIRQDPDSWTVTETGQVSVTETVTEVSPKRDRYLSQNGTGSVTETVTEVSPFWDTQQTSTDNYRKIVIYQLLE